MIKSNVFCHSSEISSSLSQGIYSRMFCSFSECFPLILSQIDIILWIANYFFNLLCISVLSSRQGSVQASVNNIFDKSSAIQDTSVNQAIREAINNSISGLLADASYAGMQSKLCSPGLYGPRRVSLIYLFHVLSL